jgi:thioredoxin reductase (NADPH)
VYLATRAAKVWLLVRGRNLEASMSRYLIERITAQPNIELVFETEVNALEGEAGALQAISCRNRSGVTSRISIRHLFLFIGAEPNTHWLAASGLALDAKGFVRTGEQAAAGKMPLDTSLAGVFAIGDVRCGCTKRLAAAVGEGAQVISAIHGYLAQTGLEPVIIERSGRV